MKKVSPDEPLIAAALVMPRGGSEEEEEEDDDDGHVHGAGDDEMDEAGAVAAALRKLTRARRRRVCAFAAVSSHGGAVQAEMQPTHNSKPPGYNPWKLYKEMSWFLKPLHSSKARLVTTLGNYVK